MSFSQLNLTLFIPNLLSHSLSDKSKAIALQKLLSKASVNEHAPCSIEEGIKYFFRGLPVGAIPSGALSALKTNGIWCRADPIEIFVDHQSAFIIGNGHLGLTEQEQTVLLKELNQHLDQDGLVISALSPNEWVCSLRNNTDVVMNDLSEVVRKNLKPLLPSGPDQDYWRRLITECQMILSSSSVNQQRMQKNMPLISSLWFWGLGKLPTDIKTDFMKVYANSSVVKGLAHCANVPYFELPAGFDDKVQGKNVLIADLQINPENVEEKLDSYEERWFKPMLDALQAGNIQEVNLIFANGVKYNIRKINLKYFWRTIKPLNIFNNGSYSA